MKSIGESSYEQFADRYAQYVDTRPHNAYYERPATLALLPDVRGLRVLDAGCGPAIYNNLLDPLITTGFVIEQVVEPRPTDDFRQADPNTYEDLMRRPGFICIRARKPEHGRAGER